MTETSTTPSTPPIDKFADRWRFLPKQTATQPPQSGYVRILRDHWWVVCPDRGLVFFHSKGEKGLGSPQCNSNESISRRLGTTLPGGVIEQIPLVFVPIELRDFA